VRKRWRVVASPVDAPTGGLLTLSQDLADLCNADPDMLFWFRRSAESAARFHAAMLPVVCRVVRVDP
jgi:hypothetical protein